MSANQSGSRALRVIGTVVLAIGVVFSLMGGIGSSCVALGAARWESMAPLVPYQWLYQILMVLTLITAIVGIWVCIGFAKGRRWSYSGALAVLAAGAILAGVQMYASAQLRGAVAPNNIRLYVNLFALVVFLLLRLPPLWSRLGLGQDNRHSGAAGGVAMIIAGACAATTPLWAGPSHTFEGQNWAAALLIPLVLAGGALVVAGVGLLWRQTVKPALAPANSRA